MGFTGKKSWLTFAFFSAAPMKVLRGSWLTS
jgi:hypothetical protein